ncbi:non-ribosomal peptide synthetase/type I polyketide synthase [Aquimarina mytili]|uniref:Phenolphthiocerol/phthiocerol polyketide synthase subunit E n=1 Tax=Aquimarina mytili TaxID=874423 RepID=A0A937A1T8_9FLAO|nr:non-ribosomal peptide synthetase/type I polyketide synthase [Aquimarina mytili]MBL0685920.1 amino acid adenylation domain-containing protein [Aquimarina mytili]
MEKYTGLEIAVIGMAGKFPEADNIEQFWDNLKNGKDCISDFTEEEVAEEGEQESLIKNPSYVKANAYLKNKKYFDSEFFGYTPHEAELMDPQVRLYHECCWEAIEDSGCNLKDRSLKVGVFTAGYPSIPWMLHTTQNPPETGFVDDFTASHLRDATFLSSRISYKFNLKGPAVFVQTACSSSLVAIHEACNSLLLGECNVVLAGGVNVKNYSKKGYLYQEGMIHSKDGKCRPFDVQSSGTVGGEGAGVVVLKRLKDAIRDRDNIQAIIKGTAINNDGSSKVGYTAPSVQGQAEVIKRAHAMARVDVNSIGYVETHGTATKLGDPIEIEALNTAFGKDNNSECAIGSVKSNIGHLDSAAGVAGFIKTVLALKNRELPPSLHYTQPNPGISFSNGPFYVNNALKQWGTTSDVLRAGVSSFGIGGTNAHLVLQEAPKKKISETNRNYKLVTLSGKTIKDFQKNVANLKAFFNENQQTDLADAAYTLQTGRDRFKYRKTIVGEHIQNVVEQLKNISSLEPVASNNREELQHVIFMFPGQGMQYVNMCKELYATENVFRKEIDKCLEYAQKYTSTDLRSILFTDVEESAKKINQTEYAQPLLFFTEYALAKLLINWGITPDYMIGHSIGEYAAACISGVFELEDAIRLVVKRGLLMSTASKGTMLNVNATKNQIDSLLEEYNTIDLAVINSENAVVVSGTLDDIDDFQNVLESRGITSKKLHTSHAFHSRMMDVVLPDFDKELNTVDFQSPQIPFISNLSGKFVTSQEVQEPSYWTQHLRNTVNFKEGIDTLLTHGDACIIEVGPGRALSNYVNENANKTNGHSIVNTVRHVKQKISDQKYLLEKLGQLWENGLKINWKQFYGDEERYKVSLPTYAFDRKEYTTDFDLNKLLNKQLVADTNRTVTEDAKLINICNWKRSILPNKALELDKEKSNFLIFTGAEGFSDALHQKLSAKQQNVVQVRHGKQFKKVNDELFEVNIATLDHIEKLWTELENIKFKADEIIYSLPLSEKYTLLDYNAIEKELDKNYLGVSYIAKTIANYQNSDEVKMTVLCNHLAKVIADDDVNPLKATLLSPAKIIPSEINTLQCKVIDIPYPFTSEDQETEYAQKVINEMFFETEDAFVAYRFKERWFKDLETVSVNEKTTSNVSLVPGGTYLIVGGTGGMGLSITAQMSSEIQGNFILIHRSDFPKKETWGEWLKVYGDTNEVSKKILQIQEIESLGSVVELHQLDVANESDVKLFSESLLDRYKQINGLIWAAGEVDYGGIILNRSKEDFIKYGASKIHGVVLFEKYIKFENFDFLALFSSIGNIIYQVKFGQVGYNAGNEFLESYAQYAKKQWGVHAFTINWCDWYDVGLTVNAVREQDKIEDIVEINSRIDHAIYPKQGVELFFKCLENKETTFNIFPGDLKKAMASQRLRLKEFRNDTTEISGEAVDHSIVNQVDDLEKTLREIYSTFFGKEIGLTDDFFEVGGDSLKAMSLAARINQKTGASLAINDIYQYPTINEIMNKLSEIGSDNQIITIPNTPSKEYYATSSEQKRMFLLQALDVNSTLYNEIEVLWVLGEINKKKVEEAFKQIIQRHESLRTTFAFVENELKQEISEEYNFQLELFEYKEGQLDDIVKSFIRPFDLTNKKEPLLRVGLVEKSPTEHLLIMDSHHIVMDGVSRFIIREEFNLLYNEASLSPLKLQYKDYAEWQNSEEQKKGLDEEKSFWLNEFSEELEPLELPTDFVRPLTRNNEGDFIRFEIGHEETKKLKEIASADGTTVFSVLVAILNVLLSKLTNQEDIVIATPVAGRQHADLENLIGMFVNTICLRSYPKGEKSFDEFLLEVKDKTLECFKNQSYPFEELVKELKIARDNSRNPLFDVMFVYQNYEEAKNETEGLVFKPEQFNHTSSRFDMTFLAVDDADQLFLRLIFSTELFTKETIQRFVSYFKNVVTVVVNNQHTLLSEIDMIPSEEKALLLSNFNTPKVDFPTNKVSIELFEEFTRKSPKDIALVDGDQSITYKELDDWAIAIAQNIDKEVRKDENCKIGILFNSSMEMIASILGVLKTGNAYVPLSPDTSEERNRYILSDCDAKLVLVQENLKTNKNVIPLVNDTKMLWVGSEALSSSNNGYESKKVSPEDIMYVIYTSGTTGTPKGVEVKYSGITNMLYAFKHEFAMKNSVRMAHLANVTFDASVFEIWPSLAFGGCLYIVSQEIRQDPELLKVWLNENKIEILFLPTVLAEHVLKNEEDLQNSSLKIINIAGDRLNYLPTKKLPYKIYNLYGPTEDSIWTTSLELNNDEVYDYYSIGKPIPNKKVLILNKYGRLQPLGVPGEICVLGEGLAKGYVNNKTLTKEKFIKNPFLVNERMYRTGDKGSWQPDGNIQFLGRIDHQVKIRGFRIELGEIEAHLSTYERFQESTVTAKGEEGDKYLVAYYVSENEVDINDLKNYLLEKLPSYMIPAYYVRMDQLPLTSNGKLNRKALPLPSLTEQNNYVGPETETEKVLTEIWGKVLGTPNIGVTDNFFLVGGDSIKSIQISSRLRSLGYEVSVKDILINKDIRSLATKLRKTLKQSDQSQVEGKAILSPIQKWFFENNLTEKHHFNQSVLLDFPDSITEDTVRSIFEKIQEHHDALRTVYKENAEGPSSYYLGIDESPVSLHVFDLRGAKDASTMLLSESKKIQSGINIQTGPLMHLGLFQMDKGSRLLIVIHHLAVDGVSWRILFEDIETLYQQIKNKETLELPLKTDSFKNWTNKLLDYSTGNRMELAQKYWDNELQKPCSILKRDYPNGENIFKHKAVKQFQLSEEATSKLLSDVHLPFGTQINDILLTAFLWTYSEFYNSKDVLIDLESHGRENLGLGENISRTVGWFTSFYPVLLQAEKVDKNNLNTLIKEVKEKLRKVPNNGIDYLIYKYLTKNAVETKNKAQISFNYLGQFDADIADSSFIIGKEDKGDEVSPEKERDYDWDCAGIITEGKLTMSLMYSAEQYNQDTINAIMTSLKQNLEQLITYCATYDKKELSPSDFIYKDLSFDQLDQLSKQYDIQNIYPLSPMQEGMLFHYLMSPESESYFGQMTFEVHGDLDIQAVEKSMNDLIARHEVFRAIFLHEGYERPIQLVLKDREIKILYRNLLDEKTTTNSIEEEVENYKKNQKSSFDLSKDLLMQLTVLRTADNTHTFIWNYHHILMDGWCTATILSEFREIYSKKRKGLQAELPVSNSYHNYIEWLENRDIKSSEYYWKNYLEGYKHPVSMPKINSISIEEAAFVPKIEHLIIGETSTNLIQELTIEYGVTVSTIIQCAWGMLLAKYNNVDEVVFGTVVSGRPSEIEGIEDMIGLFINTIPVRIRFNDDESLGDVLKTIQESALENEKHQYHPLSEIQTYSTLGRDLFDHIVVVENYPVVDDEETDSNKSDFLVKNVEMYVQSNYGLSLVVVPNEEIEIKIEYNANVYDKNTVQNILAHLNQVIHQVILPSEVEVA